MIIADQHELARHLGVSDRRIRQLEAANVIVRLDGEPVRYDLDANVRRYRMYADRDMDAACREVELASAYVDEMLGRMRAEDIVSVRWQIAEQDGGAIGQLQAAMCIANALAPEHARDMLRNYTRMSVGRAIGECLCLCNWRIVENREQASERCPVR